MRLYFKKQITNKTWLRFYFKMGRFKNHQSSYNFITGKKFGTRKMFIATFMTVLKILCQVVLDYWMCACGCVFDSVGIFFALRLSSFKSHLANVEWLINHSQTATHGQEAIVYDSSYLKSL